jgi:TetR/AcrR family transcriptional repressor of nem operon
MAARCESKDTVHDPGICTGHEKGWRALLDKRGSAARGRCFRRMRGLKCHRFLSILGTGSGWKSTKVDDIPTGWYVSGMHAYPIEPSSPGGARGKLLDAAISIIRKKGYAATSVDELCAWAGVTKGAFFHHFPSKDSLAVAAARHWSELSDALFAAAPYHRFDDPLDRILGYLDFRRAILRGDVAEFSCLAGTMLQEAYGTHPDIRHACDACIGSHAAEVESDIVDAMRLYRLRAPWTAESLALHTQAVLQGAFILAKAGGNAAVVEESIDHLRRYIKLLFDRPRKKASRKT